MSKKASVTATLVLVITVVGMAFAAKKADFSEYYKGKYLVVMQDGLALGICSKTPGGTVYDNAEIRMKVTESGVEREKLGFFQGHDEGCGLTPEPIHKGEILKSSHAAIRGKWLLIWVESLSPHAITRGVGAFEHESHELPRGILEFPSEGGYEESKTLIDRWLRPFDTQEEAAKLGNTASGAFVKEVKLGMTPAEVEGVLGVPETKVDLGKKVLYKYKNMTVQFEDGKVTDVK